MSRQCRVRKRYRSAHRREQALHSKYNKSADQIVPSTAYIPRSLSECAARPDLRRFRNAARILALQWIGRRVQAGQVEHWHETAAPDRFDLFVPSLARRCTATLE